MAFLKGKRRRFWLEAFMAALALGSAWFLFSGRAILTGAAQEGQREYYVILDAGHGGNDPGKIGVDGSFEKDLNLVIAGKVKLLLERQGVKTLMTREADAGLYDEGTKNKKVQDMKRRCSLVNQEKPSCVVSIHQNSYHEESVRGPQVFFYSASKEGKELAGGLQEELNRAVKPARERKEKANDSYYLLKKTSAPICIVECGFLSNWEESRLLQDENYQEKLAWAIHLGILKYLNK